MKGDDSGHRDGAVADGASSRADTYLRVLFPISPPNTLNLTFAVFGCRSLFALLLVWPRARP
jgi:hypothetical protein